MTSGKKKFCLFLLYDCFYTLCASVVIIPRLAATYPVKQLKMICAFDFRKEKVVSNLLRIILFKDRIERIESLFTCADIWNMLP